MSTNYNIKKRNLERQLILRKRKLEWERSITEPEFLQYRDFSRYEKAIAETEKQIELLEIMRKCI
jgi:hypothetical protein